MPSGSKAKNKEHREIRRTTATSFKEFRTSNLLTQLQLAKLLGMSMEAVQLIESQKVTPHYRTRQKFQELMNRHEHNRG